MLTSGGFIMIRQVLGYSGDEFIKVIPLVSIDDTDGMCFLQKPDKVVDKGKRVTPQD
jgi:hypothetical protein